MRASCGIEKLGVPQGGSCGFEKHLKSNKYVSFDEAVFPVKLFLRFLSNVPNQNDLDVYAAKGFGTPNCARESQISFQYICFKVN